MTRHIARSKELFVEQKKKKIREKKKSIWEIIPYSDVLREEKCKLSINGIIIILSDVLYVPDVRRNLISISMLDKKYYEIKLKSGCVTICKGNVKLKRVRI